MSVQAASVPSSTQNQSAQKPRFPRTSLGRSSNESEYSSPGSASSPVTRSCFPSPRKTTHLFNSESCDALPATVAVRASSIDCSPQTPRLTTTLKKQLTVRALFDYDPSVDTGLPGRGLAFQHGDILHVVNATDQEWWQARRLTLYVNGNPVNDLTPPRNSDSVSSTSCGGPLTIRTPLGIIPSRQRLERRQRARLKHVNFFSKVTVIGSTPPPPVGPAVLSNPSSSNGRPQDISETSNSSTPIANGRQEEPFANATSTLDRLKKTGHADSDGKSRSSSLTRSLLKRFSSRNHRKTDQLLLPGSPSLLYSVSEADLDSIRSYELVKPVTISIARPLLVFGPLKERVIDNLLHDSKFTTCVPHTSRPARVGERDGVDYHFVRSKAQMEEDIKLDRFIEVGQFQDHYYATSIDSIRRTLQTGRVCVLDVGLAAVRRLELAGLFPISVLLKPGSVQHLRNIQHRLTEDQAKRSVDLAARLEADNWRLFSAIVTFETIENAVNTIKQYVLLHGGPVIWISSGMANLNSDDLLNPGSQSSTLPRGCNRPTLDLPTSQKMGNATSTTSS